MMSSFYLVQASYFRNELVPLLKNHQVLFFTHSDSRLANNDVPDYIQRLRCRVNYRALTFAEPIQEAAETLVTRMQADQTPYIALHLRLNSVHLTVGQILFLAVYFLQFGEYHSDHTID
jgi:hypothetical protein